MPPDTLNDMILGYVVGLGLFFLTAGSIWWRYRNLAADESALAKLQTEVSQEKTSREKEAISTN